MKLSLNAKSLRIVLLVCILLLIAGAVVGFILARNQLQAFATSISQMETDASSVDSSISTLKQLEVTLKGTEDIKSKASSLTVPASDYPVSVITNIKSIAERSGVKLSSINYGDSSASGSSAPSTAAPSTPAGGTASPAAPTTPQAAQPSGVTKKTVSVSTESPVNYNAFMSFIKGIETSDMYMHITKLSITKADGNSVNVQPFTVEVYTK